MGNVSRKLTVVALVLSLVLSSSGSLLDDDKPKEESAGTSFSVFVNGTDRIYGAAFGTGAWITGTPVFGDMFFSGFSNDIEDSSYSGVGMTIRIMPHWGFAPFIGAGGSYNYSLSDKTDSSTNNPADPVDKIEDRGESYAAGHAETGFRIWMSNRVRLFEVLGRYTWSGHGRDRDYWLVGIGTGTDW